MPTPIGNVNYRLGLDSKGLRADINRSNRILNNQLRRGAQLAGRTFQQSIRGAVVGGLARVAVAISGAFAIRNVIQSFKNGINEARIELDELAKTSRNLDFPVADFQSLSLVASEAGINSDTFSRSISRAQDTLGEAIAGTLEAKESFRELGISLDDAVDLSQIELFERLGDAIGNLGDQASRVRLARNILGRQGADLLGLFGQGDLGGRIQEGRQFFQRQGVQFSEPQLANVEKMNDAFARLGLVMRGLFQRITIDLSPSLERLATTLTNEIGNINRGLQEGTIDITSNFEAVINRLGESFINLNETLARTLDAVRLIGQAIETISLVYFASRAVNFFKQGAGAIGAFRQSRAAIRDLPAEQAAKVAPNRITSQTAIQHITNAVKLSADAAFTGFALYQLNPFQEGIFDDVQNGLANLAKSLRDLDADGIDDRAQALKRFGEQIRAISDLGPVEIEPVIARQTERLARGIDEPFGKDQELIIQSEIKFLEESIDALQSPKALRERTSIIPEVRDLDRNRNTRQLEKYLRRKATAEILDETQQLQSAADGLAQLLESSRRSGLAKEAAEILRQEEEQAKTIQAAQNAGREKLTKFLESIENLGQPEASFDGYIQQIEKLTGTLRELGVADEEIEIDFKISDEIEKLRDLNIQEVSDQWEEAIASFSPPDESLFGEINAELEVLQNRMANLDPSRLGEMNRQAQELREILATGQFQALTQEMENLGASLNPRRSSRDFYKDLIKEINELEQAFIDLDAAVAGVDFYNEGIREEFNQYRQNAQLAAVQSNEYFQSAMNNIDAAIGEMVRNGKFQFKDLVRSILADLAQITIRKNITEPLFSALFSAIGASAGDAAAGTGGGGGKATGGIVKAGTPYVVGERGREIFLPDRTGYIVPNSQLTRHSLDLEKRDETVMINQTINVESGVSQDEFALGLEQARVGIINELERNQPLRASLRG